MTSRPRTDARPFTEFEVTTVLASPDTSQWLKGALAGALGRDPVDAVNDAAFLLDLLSGRLATLLKKTAS